MNNDFSTLDGYKRAVEMLRAQATETPEMTIEQSADWLEGYIQTMRESFEDLTDRALCRNCGKPISSFNELPWRHEDEERSRGCRAASYDPDGGDGSHWDETLDRKLRALPPKGFTNEPAEQR